VRRKTAWVAVALCLAFTGTACGNREDARTDSVSASLEVEGAAGPSALMTVPSERVQGRTGPSGEPFEVALRRPAVAEGFSRRFGSETFQIALRLRIPNRSQYPCSSCHVAGGLVVTPDRIDDAHQDVQPVHPSETGATCGTCHAADEVDMLVLFSGERLSIDHAYRLCAQCHYAQVDDWAAGAHGKRLDGWRGSRVVMGCADCHDPHTPALEPRIPFPGASLPATGRGH
jgi:hypothetical protein